MQHLVDAAPELVLTQDMFGLTPVAIAVGRGAPVGTVELLLHGPPGGAGLRALRLTSASTYLPLHDAAAMGSALPVLRALLEGDLSAAATPTRGGDLPLHIAAGGKSPPESLRALALAFPLGAALANGRGRRPWELASENQLEPSLVELLHVRDASLLHFTTPCPVQLLLCGRSSGYCPVPLQCMQCHTYDAIDLRWTLKNTLPYADVM